jgi:hypothetical protein
MRKRIEQIRQLLSQLESEASHAEQAGEFRALSGLELPDIICDVVDLLMPELKPYEVALYFHFLRHSIIEKGTPYFRASRRGLQAVVFKSARNENGGASYGAVQDAMNGLERLGNPSGR